MLNRAKWLQRPNVSLRWAAICVGVWVGILSILYDSQIAMDIDVKISQPSYFRIRDSFGNAPKINDKIKVFAIDDSTVSWANSQALTLEQWVEILESLDQRKPQAIIIDSLFTIANIPESQESEKKSILERLNHIVTPIIAGAYVAPKKIPFRIPLDLNDPIYQLESYIQLSDNQLAPLHKEIAKHLGIHKSLGKWAYGPDHILREYFSHIGHILYFGNGRFIPFLRIDEQKVVPHIMMPMTMEPKFYRGHLYIRKSKLPLYKDGSALINFNSYRDYLNITKPLRSIVDSTTNNKSLQAINSGDYVYILPSFYTGNTDFKQTPFGPMPAGFAHLAVLNSALNNDWLHPIEYQYVIIVTAAILGAILAAKVNTFGFVVVSLGFLSLWLLGAFYLFTFENIVAPLVIPIFAFWGPLITVFVENSRIAEQKSRFIRHAWEGLIRPRELNALVKVPEKINLEARERVVSIMFIDVVGFSLMAESQLPRIAFDSLKEVLSDIAVIVHEYGGIVNKNLGDGLLCFFGYSLDKDETSYDHAEKATECAIKIQRANVPKMLSAFEKKEPVYPLRIGINTSSVYLGDLGTRNRLDFTVVGNGVNFAKRLEGACTTNCVLIGATTKELIEPLGIYQEDLVKRYIEIKHHEEKVEAWEYDPFGNDLQQREYADHAYKSSTNQARVETRWLVDKPDRVILTTNMGMGELVNFSSSGLSIKLPSLIVKGALLTLGLDSQDGKMKEALIQEGLESLNVEVRWSYQDGKEFLHGVQYKNVSPEQLAFIVETLCRYCSVYKPPSRHHA